MVTIRVAMNRVTPRIGFMINTFEDLIGYRFNDESLLSEAMTHASIADRRHDSNERMEFLGDAVLGFVVCEYLYRSYPELLEGEMTKIKSSVVSRRTCAQVSEAIELAEQLNLGKGMADRGELPSSVNAAALEAIIAAVYLDGGMDPARDFILRHFVPIIEQTAESAHQDNYKSLLQQHAQQESIGHPQYVLLDEKGPDHAKCFEVCVEIDHQRYPSAWANSKKEAEQKAAEHALLELGVMDVMESKVSELEHSD